MSTWTDRPQEEVRLFNPGFLGLLAWSTASGHGSVTKAGAPFATFFLALPVVLHKPTREALPHTTRTSLAAWLGDNTRYRVGFAERARSLAPFIRESLLFGILHGLLSISEGGTFRPSDRPRGMASYLRNATAEVRDCARRAAFVGKWFGAAGEPSTVMTLWGVAP